MKAKRKARRMKNLGRNVSPKRNDGTLKGEVAEKKKTKPLSEWLTKQLSKVKSYSKFPNKAF